MRKRILIIIIIIFVFSLGGVAAYFLLDYLENNKVEENPITQILIEEESLNTPIQKIYDAVVVVETYKGLEVYSTGTGFVYKTDEEYGYIITNEHVVADSSIVQVTFPSSDPIDAVILGSDIFLDIAILKIPKENVKLVSTIGDSTKSLLGDTVFTVGTPLGTEYKGTVTKGIISGKDRLVTVTLTGSQTGDWIMKVIQTDAAINPGNSGGPLVNINGDVIGINSLKFVEEEVEGMGFAIPIEYAMSHIEKLEAGETIERPLLGVQLFDLDETYNIYKSGIVVDEAITEGVLIEKILKDTPAEVAGLKKGDVLLKIDDEKINNKSYLRYILYKYDIDDTITITYFNDEEEKTVEVVLDTVSE